MSFLKATERFLTAIGTGIGRVAAWLILPMVILTTIIVVLRYGFNFGRIYLQEAVMYMHAALFMLTTAWVLHQDKHVRIDLFYRGRSHLHHAWVNLLGALFLLLPTACALLWLSLDYTKLSWTLLEVSRERDGIPFIYLLKTIIPVTAGLLILQGISAFCHHLRRLLELYR